jgi:hypothetical protein
MWREDRDACRNGLLSATHLCDWHPASKLTLKLLRSAPEARPTVNAIMSLPTRYDASKYPRPADVNTSRPARYDPSKVLKQGGTLECAARKLNHRKKELESTGSSLRRARGWAATSNTWFQSCAREGETT